MVDGEWIPLTPQLTRYPLHKHWHGKLAQIVVVTGEVDYVTDGYRAVGIHGGDPLMTKVVGIQVHYRRLSLPAVRYQAIRWKMSHLPVTG